MNEAYPDCDLTLDDLRVALREMGTYVDITEEDLLKIYTLAQQAAKDRISRSVPVSSVMTTEVAIIGEEATLEQAARVLSEKGVSGLPVVGEERHVVGVISEGDLLCTTGMERRRGILSFIVGEPPKCELNARVKDFMSKPPLVVRPATDIREAARILDEKRMKRLPVVDEKGRLVGIISRADIVRQVGKP